jgi:hypothetical protein
MVVTDAQVVTLHSWLNKEASLTYSAAKAGMDRKTARKYRDGGSLPSQRTERTWRTRVDPFADVWNEVETLLERESGWEAKTLFEELQRRYPGRFAEGQLRTLQRRIKQWLATRGPDKEVFFAQEHLPGQLGASDFTHMTDLGVTIGGQLFEHLVYHFVLTSSNWEHATICFSESFESFSEGFQNAVWALGGVPVRHRSDRMSLAVQASGSQFFTRRYEAVMAYYGVKPQAINAGKGHENGDAEQSHHRFKEAMNQALLLRGSRDFSSREAYTAFLHEVLESRKAKRKEAFEEEKKHLHGLPAKRLESFRRIEVRVQRGSTIAVERNIYSVPSRLIGERVEARVYAETIEVWYGNRKEEEVLPRLRGRHKHRINYRHVIEWLVRKPGAFAGYRYREEMFPTSRFRMAYDALAARSSGRTDREYLEILQLAARESEVAVDEALRRLLETGSVSAVAVKALVEQGMTPAKAMEVSVEPINLLTYDELLESKEQWYDSDRGEGCLAAFDERFEGIAPADDAGSIPECGPASSAGVGELRAVSTGVSESGMRDAEAQACGTIIEGFAVAAGEEPGDVRLEAAAGEGASASAYAVAGGVRGTAGECVGVWSAGFGQDAFASGVVSRTCASGSARLLLSLQFVGAGSAVGQAEPSFAAILEEAVELRCGVRGRSGLRAAKPRGDGSVVHVLGGALRTRQRALDEQFAVLEVGTNFSGSDDDGGGDRPISSSQRDRGNEFAELSGGAGEEGQGKAARGDGEGRMRPRWGCSAARSVAALRPAPLRNPTAGRVEGGWPSGRVERSSEKILKKAVLIWDAIGEV